jgi:cysteine desulfurase
VIYADNAATTRISDSVFEKMLPFLREQYGNASSQYSLGVKAKRAVEHARRQVAVAIGANASEITFTSGGSEANSWVIRSVAETYRGKPMHIITSEIEHHSVLNACRALEQTDIEVTYLPVNATGVVEVTSLKEVIRPHTKLVSIMLANNEIGTVQPVEEIGQLLKSKGILFHTDAVQAVGHVPVNVSRLGVDFLTASAHKFNGAKGTGILYKRSGIDLSPLVFGGKQEYGLRAGTENVAGIVSAGYAIEESISLMADEAKRLRKMVEDTVDGIKEKIPSVRVNGDSIYRLPGTVNLGFDGVSGEALMNLLDLKGICVSTSSACTSGKDEPSHVLLALGLSEQQAKSAIRISYGRYNTSDEVGKVISAVYDAYSKILGTR